MTSPASPTSPASADSLPSAASLPSADSAASPASPAGETSPASPASPASAARLPRTDSPATSEALAAAPYRGWRALLGISTAAAATAVATAVATWLAPAAGPLTAIGSTLIDLAPTPAKEFVVRTFGNYDKPLLIGLVALILLAVAASLGVLSSRHRRWALAGVVGLGVIAGAAALARPGATPLWAIPAVTAIIVGVAGLAWGTRTPQTDGLAPASGSRRRLLGTVLGSAAAVLVGAGASAAISAARTARSAAARLRGLPAPESTAAPIPSGAQVPGNTPFITPTADFYRVDIALTTPIYDTQGWTLTVDGMVERPLTLSYDDVLNLPLIERDLTLTCVSNEVGGKYVSTGRWLGVPLTEILDRVGPHAGVEQMFSYSLDSGYTCSTPFQAVTDIKDAMIAVGLNGEPLPAANGYPARLVIPGLFGFVSGTKWLQRLEFTTYAQRVAYWTKRDWATDAPILTQSRIDVPTSLSTLPKDKPVIAGVAWAQTRGIAKVEIQIDDQPWTEATLAADAGINLWRQWFYRYTGPAGPHRARVRATDLTGAVQPEQRTKVFPSGATGWHEIRFVAE